MKLPTSYRAQLGPAAEFLLNFDWLYARYVHEKLSTRQIASQIGCGKKAVTTALKRHNIAINYEANRDLAVRHRRFVKQVPAIAVGKLDSYEWMKRTLLLENKSWTQIATELGVSERCVWQWVKRHKLHKPKSLTIQCMKRRYAEVNGVEVNSIEACKKRMGGRRAVKINTTKGGDVNCHSSWEACLAHALDQSPYVINFWKDTICIPYELDGKQRVYYPDFLILFEDGSRWLVEVKDARLLNERRIMAKHAALIDYCQRTGITPFVLSSYTKIDPQQLFDCYTARQT